MKLTDFCIEYTALLNCMAAERGSTVFFHEIAYKEYSGPAALLADAYEGYLKHSPRRQTWAQITHYYVKAARDSATIQQPPPELPSFMLACQFIATMPERLGAALLWQTFVVGGPPGGWVYWLSPCYDRDLALDKLWHGSLISVAILGLEGKEAALKWVLGPKSAQDVEDMDRMASKIVFPAGVLEAMEPLRQALGTAALQQMNFAALVSAFTDSAVALASLPSIDGSTSSDIMDMVGAFSAELAAYAAVGDMRQYRHE